MFERIPRWRPTLGAALVVASVGVWQRSSALLIAAMIPIGYIAYSAVTSARPVESALQIERAVAPTTPIPGRAATVTLTVENTGERPLVDLRLVDGVPESLPVTDGSPRAGIGLRAGETASISYTVTTHHGQFAFDPVRVRARSLSAASSYTTDIEADGVQQIETSVAPPNWPQDEQTIALTGSEPSDRGGEGIEFHTTRQYQPGDPVNRIDWRHYARDGELTTINYRRSEAAEIVVVIDARQPNNIARRPDRPTAVEACVYAGATAAYGLHGAGQQVGLSAIGISDPRADGDRRLWVRPGNGEQTRIRLHRALDHVASVASPTSETELGQGTDAEIDWLQTQLSANSRVLLVTPLLDQFPVTLIRQLRVTGHDVNVLAPDITDTETAGKTLARIDRLMSLTDARKLGATVVDWDPETPLGTAVGRTVQ